MEKTTLWTHICRSVGSSGTDLVNLYLNGLVPISRIVEEFGGSAADLVQEYESCQ